MDNQNLLFVEYDLSVNVVAVANADARGDGGDTDANYDAAANSDRDSDVTGDGDVDANFDAVGVVNGDDIGVVNGDANGDDHGNGDDHVDGDANVSGDMITSGDVIAIGYGYANGNSDGVVNINAANADAKRRGGDICPVCLNAIDIYCVGACNHPLCLDCWARLIIIHEDELCPLCRRLIRNPLITEVKATYKIPLKQHEKITSDYNQIINSSSAKIINAFNNLVQHQCPKCPARVFKMLERLQQHMATKHKLYYCDVCISKLDMFTRDRIYYTSSQLKYHVEKGDRGGLTRNYHPLCEFCHIRLFNLKEYVDHFISKHYYCPLCRAQQALFLFGSYHKLLKHLDEYHFPCLVKKCNKLFDDSIEFLTHFEKEHLIDPHYIYPKINRTAVIDIEIKPSSKQQGVEVFLSENIILQYWAKPLIGYDISYDYSSPPPKPRVIFDFHNKLQFPPLGCKPRNIKKLYKQLLVPAPSTSSILTTNAGGVNTSILSKPTYAEVAASFGSKL